MASNPTSSKLGNTSSPASSPATSQAGPSLSADNASRRSGGSGSFGAGSATRSGGGQPRKQQGLKNQHKHSRRYRLADEDAIAESAAMRSFTNKKGQTSITHLMNFSLPPRPTSYYQPNYQRNVNRNPRWGLGSGHTAVDKARYVHANYRFVVDPSRGYHEQSIDADVYLEWATVLQILASPVSQTAACPICLGDPVAPRMAKCGHIFCLHCLIRYMHSSDGTDRVPEKKTRWKSCPICWDSMYMHDMRAVKWYQGQEIESPREGGDIVLRLVVRPAGSTLALPKDTSAACMKGEEIPWHFAADVMDFARVMKGTAVYMQQQYDEEISQLELLEQHDEVMFGDDNEWTQKAIRSCQEAKERMKNLGTPKDPITPEPTGKGKSSDLATSTPGISSLSSSIAQYRQSQHQSHAPSDYYFYQALQHHYLSPLDIRILKASFGSYAAFPSTILPRVERLSTGHVIDDELRRRHKYLSHLPHGCEVAFLECDWTDTVPADVLEKFKDDIERRRKRNADKEAREERERIRAEREEDEKRWREARRPKRPTDMLDSTNHIDSGEFQSLAAQSSEPTDELAGVESTSPVWGSRLGTDSAFGALASPSSSPNASRTVWGTAAIAPTSPVLQVQAEPVQDDGWLHGWEKELLDEDADIVAQMEGVSLDSPASSSKTTGESSAKKKGKKGKKITLMSTNARRGV